MIGRTTAGLLFTITLSLGGCVNCENLRTWQGGERERPSNAVAALRYYLCTSNWNAAAQTILSGSEYTQARQGDPATAAYWKVPSPIVGAGQLFFPLGPEDSIGGERPHGSGVQVEIRHKRRYDKDPRPRGLLLTETNGEWLIVGYRNW